jgi:Flp pilus assembly protein TadG
MVRTCKPVSSQRGQGVVEIALILPIFLLTVLGMLDLGRAVYTHTVLSNSVREGCRVAVVQSRPSSDVIQAVLQSAAGVNLPASNITISGARTPGSTVTVSAFVVYSPVTPLLSQIVRSAITLRASSAMVVD